MITTSIRYFIKENIDLIDEEDWFNLFTRTIEELDRQEIIDLIDLLETQLNVSTKTQREEVLYNEISNTLSLSSTWVLVDLLDDAVSNYLGFTYQEIIDFLLSNKFNLNIDIFQRGGRWVVETI